MYLELRQELIGGTRPLVTLSGLGQPQDLFDVHLLQRCQQVVDPHADLDFTRHVKGTFLEAL